MRREQDAPATLTPKLRFPEFRDADGWEERSLGSVCQMQAGKFVGASDIHERSAPGLYPCYGGNGLRGYTKSFTHSGKFPLIGRQGALCGNVRLGLGQFHATEHAVVTTPEPGVDVDWLFYVLGFLNLNRFATGQAQPGLSVDVIAKIPVSKPVHETEQQKIAECLTTLDEVIAAQSQKLDALKTHKKGLMQQLFPREGETLPRLRFPEFQAAPEWEEDKLDHIASFRRGSFPQPYGLPEWYDSKNGTPFIQVFDVGADFRLKEETKSKISKLGAEKSVFIPKGTLIVTLQGSIGRVAITHYDAYIDRTLLIFESFQKPIETAFFARVIQNLFDIEKEKAPGGIIKTITKEVLSDFKVKLPSIPEQQRIATCLTSLDSLITAQSAKLSALKTHKKGLMQQLFPSPEEVEA